MLEAANRRARAAEPATHVRVADFDGPLGLLLSLIEARRLDVLTVPLGALAGAYLDALANLPAERLGNVSAFVAIASQLILIKSRALLPRPPIVRSSSPTTSPTRRPSSAPACCSTGPTATPAGASRTPPRRRPCSGASPGCRGSRSCRGPTRAAPPLPVALLERALAAGAARAGPTAPPRSSRAP